MNEKGLRQKFFVRQVSAPSEGSGVKPYLPENDARTASARLHLETALRFLIQLITLLQHFIRTRIKPDTLKAGDEVLGKETSRIQDVELLVKDPYGSTLQYTAEQKRHAITATKGDLGEVTRGPYSSQKPTTSDGMVNTKGCATPSVSRLKGVPRFAAHTTRA
ncbi:hypothetical protein HII31_01082, partial [Pseudocercospora fuligena]